MTVFHIFKQDRIQFTEWHYAVFLDFFLLKAEILEN